MEDILVINGKLYVHTPEPVKVRERLEGYVNRALFRYFKSGDIHEISSREMDTHMIEIREGEVIVSKESFAKAWDLAVSNGALFCVSEASSAFKQACKALGLK